MNIKTVLWIFQSFFEKINPNIYDEEDDEVPHEIQDDIKKDYLYLIDCYKGIINPNSIKKD